MSDARRRVWSLVLSGREARTSRLTCGAAPLSSRARDAARQTGGPGPGPGEGSRLRGIDLAQKIRREKDNGGVNRTPPSAGERRVSELKQLSQQLQNVHPNVLAKHLHKTAAFQNRDVVVLNKPYGVPVRGGGGLTSVSSVLPVLVKMMAGMRSGSELHACLGLEKEATGALLLARSKEAVEHILNLHKNNEVQRKYWTIAVGVPVPSEGVIDIPIIEREISGPQHHFKMGLSPVYKINDTGEEVTRVRPHRQAHSAVTKYRVLDNRGGCSLVELQPLTDGKHQLRVHMAYALACPILGDHKYSHWSKLAPQKLQEHVLGKLGLEQSKTRHLPLHLHARQLTLPMGKSQPDIRVSCILPKYFAKTLHRLGLTVSDEEEPK